MVYVSEYIVLDSIGNDSIDDDTNASPCRYFFAVFGNTNSN